MSVVQQLTLRITNSRYILLSRMLLISRMLSSLTSQVVSHSMYLQLRREVLLVTMLHSSPGILSLSSLVTRFMKESRWRMHREEVSMSTNHPALLTHSSTEQMIPERKRISHTNYVMSFLTIVMTLETHLKVSQSESGLTRRENFYHRN